MQSVVELTVMGRRTGGSGPSGRSAHTGRSAMRMTVLLRMGTAALCLAGIATADTIIGSIPGLTPTGYPIGNLNQEYVDCGTDGSSACGPSAATNSFVMLQNRYPTIYDHSLVPYAGTSPTQSEMAVVANELVPLMDCDDVDGTYIENFIYGKWTYIEAQVPDKTVYQAYVAGSWTWRDNPNGTSGYDNGGQPSWVTRGAPTAEWLAAELNDGEDVEIFIEYDSGGAHYLTLGEITFDTETNIGSIGFMDSLTGAWGTADITGLNTWGYLTLDYGNGSTLWHAVSESPVPEPGTYFLFALGTITLLIRARGRSRAS